MARPPKRGLFDRMMRRNVVPVQDASRQIVRRGRARAEYDGASVGRRTTSWRRDGRDANSELNTRVMLALRGMARDLVRNNPFAARGVSGIANNMIGTGITFQIYRNGKIDQPLTDLARRHFDTTACDASGRHDFYGLQVQAARTIAVSGAVVTRRRWRRGSDGLPVPFQMQVLEPDYINTQLTGPLPNGGWRIQGIEMSPIGQRTGYQMYSGHPGSLIPGSLDTTLIPATEISHCYRSLRPEDQHGESWFAPVIVRMKDFGEYEDAQLVRQKIASCFAGFRAPGDSADLPEPATDSNGNPIDDEPYIAAFEPGIIETLAPGETITFNDPPGVDGYADYSRVSLQAIAAGLGVPYEVLTNDLTKVNFSSGRLGWLEFQRSLATWQWTMFIPQFCEPAGQWFLQAAAMSGVDVTGATFQWTPPRREMIDPATEVPAIRDAIRAGLQTPSGAVRERGDDPDKFFAEWAADAATLDKLGLIFDSDPRKVTQVGNSLHPGATPPPEDKEP